MFFLVLKEDLKVHVFFKQYLLKKIKEIVEKFLNYFKLKIILNDFDVLSLIAKQAFSFYFFKTLEK